MKRLHLSSVLQFLTSRRDGDIFSHFTANEDGERDIKMFSCSVSFCFLRPAAAAQYWKISTWTVCVC